MLPGAGRRSARAPAVNGNLRCAAVDHVNRRMPASRRLSVSRDDCRRWAAPLWIAAEITSFTERPAVAPALPI